MCLFLSKEIRRENTYTGDVLVTYLWVRKWNSNNSNDNNRQLVSEERWADKSECPLPNYDGRSNNVAIHFQAWADICDLCCDSYNFGTNSYL